MKTHPHDGRLCVKTTMAEYLIAWKNVIDGLLSKCFRLQNYFKVSFLLTHTHIFFQKRVALHGGILRTYFLLCGFFPPHTLGACLQQLSRVILCFSPQGVLEDGLSSNGVPRSTAPGGISNPEKRMSCGTQCPNPQSLTSGPLTQKQNGLRTMEVGDSHRMNPLGTGERGEACFRPGPH